MSADIQSERLAKYFGAVVLGKQEVQDQANFKRFVKAILDQSDPCIVVQRIVSSPSALNVLQSGLRFNLSSAFINEYTAKLIQYLNHREVKLLCNGKFLEQILLVILEPRTLWNAFLEAFRTRKLDDDAIRALCWLLTELLSLPASSGVDVRTDAQAVLDDGSLLSSASMDTRNLGHKIKYLLEMKSSAATLQASETTAGGRHDNDFADFRLTTIFPTADEMGCTEKPFYRRAEDVAQLPDNQRIAGHIDNQFRLLREDMLSELRDDFQIARGTKKGRRSAVHLKALSLARLRCTSGPQDRLRPCTVGVTAQFGLERLKGMSKEARKTFLKNTPNFVKHRAFGCLIRDTELVAFATIEREIDDLVSNPPVVMLRIAGEEAVKKSLLCLKLYNDLEFLIVDTAMFAYEPILKCLQERVDLPLTEELFLYEKDQPIRDSSLVPWDIVNKLKEEIGFNIQNILQTPKPVTLDPSQLDSLLAGLTQRVSLIQGPPGTGKSFIGALLAKTLHDNTKDKILVMCYTNHALDQFLEDLLDIGINSSAIVRIGSKSTQRTEPLGLFKQQSSYRRTQTTWNTIKALEADGNDQLVDLDDSFQAYKKLAANAASILDYLEFEEPKAFEALSVPEDENGMTTVAKGGKSIKKEYLYNRWIKGKNAGVCINKLPAHCRDMWTLDLKIREEKDRAWKRAVLGEQAESLGVSMALFDKCQSRLSATLGERSREILKEKQIIGCTTTAAAMYSEDIRHASPGIVLLEEAGEILESHVLTAMTPETKHLILIGDHQQLRPKINSYSLSTEKGDGYDLNVSLFERLIHAGFPHTTLLKQHRMCPEISSFVRNLTYPGLEDAPKTKNRPQPRGLCDRVIFFHHQNPEEIFSEISDLRDENSKGSKRNSFEADVVLKIVKYLGQQGYGTDKLVILTPYLGQLSLLRHTLSKQNDPVLNDIDSHDLVKAGLLSQASASHAKRQIRLSTIDNFQGEESEIVIASLTRSNKVGDIGFMAAPERLNVLLSRARNVLILVGNSETFVSSRKGQRHWKPFIDQLKSNGHLYDGLPVRCEQHPQTNAILRTPDDFDRECPDGGCSAPCGVKLSCGVHECPSKCHQLADHSKMKCTKIVKWKCPRGHSLSVACSQTKRSCHFCILEDQIKERKRKRDLELEKERKRKQDEYAQKLAEAQEEASYLKRLRRDEFDDAERAKILEQHRQEIENLKNPPQPATIQGSLQSQITTSIPSIARSLTPTNVPSITTKIATPPIADKTSTHTRSVEPPTRQKMAPPKQSAAETDWAYQKKFLNAQSQEIDKLMDMTGLESVKEKFLSIKAKVDVAVRQNVDPSRDRFGSVLLGNPGTGKTTVARLYAKFLASMGVIPGDKFVETTGSRLANDGISGCQKTLETLLKDGGGAMFIDEAYQLVGSSFGGTQVLDFLLAEVESLTGKVVFILAGYQRPMEKFFAHNPGLPSRFPHELKFADFDDSELMQILGACIERTYRKQMKVEDGLGGLYCRIVARRIGRGRGREGFANARAVENTMTKISERQAARLSQERRQAVSKVDDFFLSQEDLIGPDPSQALMSSNAWQKLQTMIGLGAVKRTVQAILDTMRYNYQREIDEKPLVEYSLNKVFLGNPGTGKTSIAKIYGQILVDIGFLSNGEVVVKNPSDFVGSVIGESEKNTKGILASTLGKVLVIDEAYGLFAGGTSDGTGSKSDPFRVAAVDTIVAEVQSTPGDDRCVLLLGYKDLMEEMFQKVNPGLSRRFPMDQAFVFEDFTADELDSIVDLKLQEQGFGITDRGRRVVLEMLERARNRPHFGNAGEIDNLLNGAKMHYQKRLASSKHPNSVSDCLLDAPDFDEDFDRADRNESVAKLFEGVIGCESIVAQLEGYRQTVQILRQLGRDPREQLPFNFVFRGPPGTGKTSTARKMGQVYYDMGLLASSEVVETSATDLVGQYVGQTGPKTQQVLERGLGKVLFIDEAYRLADGKFAQEAMDEIVDGITKPKFAQKLIIILAGYDADIERLLQVNAGLRSRFSASVQFGPLPSADCIQLLCKLLLKEKNDLLSNSQAQFDLVCLESPDSGFMRGMVQRFDRLSRTPGWANARDVETLKKTIFGKVLQSSSGKRLALGKDTVLEVLDSMINERSSGKQYLQIPPSTGFNGGEQIADLPVRTQISSSPVTKLDSQNPVDMDMTSTKPDTKTECQTEKATTTAKRDDGVTDEVWDQLEKDKALAEEREKEYLRVQEEEDRQKEMVLKLKEEEEKAARELEDANKKADEDAKRRHEQARLKHELERRRQEAILEKLRKQQEALAEARRKEQANQTKLRTMGLCIAGFQWLKQAGGYRCAGGTHWVSDAQLGDS
ncbi:ATPase AAA-type core [Penicillium paradoxum]|uniref:ATPase AAA-type core n=1 Tax=Penicillium paradoxum TaxID=176176 RepID=UPI00254677CF|nr:ATPase AAA-type core [Penicillium paradoxum]KAJ5779630.1 ATPase AAA-type core [Penicillium paradoxum]